MITDQNGAVTSRKDFTAFGEETITPQRTTALKYQPREVRQDYTGYEKDEESGLEFAQARYYNPQHGRFTSTDPLTASATIRNPQTFNRYSYVLNSPYKFVDPLGLISSSTGACGQWCANSGPYVDGSAFHGRDASHDWMTLAPEKNFSASSGGMPSTAQIKAMLDKYTEGLDRRYVYSGDENPANGFRLEPTCPNGCRNSQPTQPTEIVFYDLPIYWTEEGGGQAPLPPGIPAAVPFTDFYIERRWNLPFYMQLETSNGVVSNDYEYEVTYDNPDMVLERSNGRQSPENGEAFLGTFRVQRRRFDPSDYDKITQSLTDTNTFSTSGTVTIFDRQGRIARARFQVTIDGNNAPSVTPPTPLNWIRPSP